MNLLVVRHGETDWNNKNLVLGQTEIPLNENGKDQANRLGKELTKLNISIIYSSPLGRAIETSEIIKSYQKDSKLVIKDCLIEQNFGVFEGKKRTNSLYQNAKKDPILGFENGESALDLAARIYPFLDEITKLHVDNVLIVAHGCVCKIIKTRFEKINTQEYCSLSFNNCEISQYTI